MRVISRAVGEGTRLRGHSEQIFVTFASKTFTIDIKQTSTVGVVKRAIQDLEGIPRDQLCLTFAGRQLEDGLTLRDCHVEQNSTLLLSLPICGGGLEVRTNSRLGAPTLAPRSGHRVRARSLQGDAADFSSDSSAPTLATFSDLTSSRADHAVLQALSSDEEDPAGLFSWNDGNVDAFHAAASAIPVLVAIPPFAINATPNGFKTALLQFLTAQAAPGALLIEGGKLGITCVGADGFGRLVSRMDTGTGSVSSSAQAWAARVFVAAPHARPLATQYTGCAGAAGKDGGLVRVFLMPGGLFA